MFPCTYGVVVVADVIARPATSVAVEESTSLLIAKF
jgi:hypothetical protein